MRRNKTDKRFRVDFVSEGEMVTMIVKAQCTEKAEKKVISMCKNQIQIIETVPHNVMEFCKYSSNYREVKPSIRGMRDHEEKMVRNR